LPCTGEGGGGLSGEGGGGGFAAGGFLEEEEGGEGFAGDVVMTEDGDHVVGQGADFGGVPLPQVGDDQVQGGEGGVEGVVVGEERLADGGEEVTGVVVIAQAGGDAAFDPIQAEAIQGAPLLGGEGAEVRQEIGGLGVAAHFGQIVDEVVTDAEEEARVAGGVDEAVGFLEGEDGGVGFRHLNEDGGRYDETPACEVGIALLGLAVEEEVLGLVEELEGFGETPLHHAERGFEVQKDGLVAEDVSDARGAGFPPGVRHAEVPFGSGEIALHAAGVGVRGPGEAAELVDPLVLEGIVLGDPVRRVDGQVGEVEGLGGLVRRCLTALADQELAESPAHEAGLGVEADEAVFGRRGEEVGQEARGFRSGAGEDGVDEAEEGRQGSRLVELEEPASRLGQAASWKKSCSFCSIERSTASRRSKAAASRCLCSMLSSLRARECVAKS